MKLAGHVARMGHTIGAYRFLVGWPEEQRQLGRPIHRWQDNNKNVSSRNVIGETRREFISLRIVKSGGLL